MKRLTAALKKKLRDPIWQAIGAILAFIALLSPFIAGYFLSSSPHAQSRLMISTQTSKDLTDFPEPVSKRMRILIDGNEESNLRLFIFLIEFKGEQPVRSADFEAPMRGKVPNDRKLVAVQNSPNVEGPLKYDRETNRLARDERSPVKFEAEILDSQTFEIRPVLMNPGEWGAIEIYTAAKDAAVPPTSTPKTSVEKYKDLSSEISWSCHVAGVQCPGSWDFDIDFDYLGFDGPWYLQVYVSHQGWEIYFILLFTIANLITMVLLAKAVGFQRLGMVSQLLLFSVAIAASVGSADVASDWLFPDIFDFGQPLYAYVIFWVDIGIVLVLGVVAVLKRKSRNSLRTPAQKAIR